MSEETIYGSEYVASEWPHGLSCPRCNRVLGEGDRYARVWNGFVDETPVVLIVCLECALGGERA